MCQRADTIGVFQIESRAQQSMLPRLKPACFYDLVIEVAIVRPGPIQGGMVHPYLRAAAGTGAGHLSERRRQERARAHARRADLPGAGDAARDRRGRIHARRSRSLRRSMAAWRRKGGLEKFEQRLIDGMAARGYAEAFARQIYQQILGFGEYGFPESHSASFALLVYVSAWLKRYEPAAFTGALLNSQPMGFYAPAQLVQRRAPARRRGAARRRDGERLGLHARGSANEGHRPSGAAPRPAHGRGPLRSRRAAHRRGAACAPFASVADLAHRAALDRRDLARLAEADALAALAGHRHDAAWDVAGVERLPPLLAGGTFAEAAPELPRRPKARTSSPTTGTLSLTLRRHPLALLRDQLAQAAARHRGRDRATRRTAASCAPRASSSAASGPTPRAA